MTGSEWVGVILAGVACMVALFFVVAAVVVVKRVRLLLRSAEEAAASVARAQQSIQAGREAGDGGGAHNPTPG